MVASRSIPGQEHEVTRERPQSLEEPLAGHQFPPRRAPRPAAQVAAVWQANASRFSVASTVARFCLP